MNAPTAHDELPLTTKAGRNFGWLTLSGLISIANSVAIWIAFARMRDVDEVGRFAIVMGMYALFHSIVSLGLVTYLINEISRRREANAATRESIPTFISSSAIFLMLSGIVFALAMSATGFWVSDSWVVRISVLALCPALVPTGLITLFESAAISYGRGRLVACATTVENLLRTIIPLVLIWADFSIFSVCLSFAVVRFIALAVYLVVARHHVRLFRFSMDEFRKIASVCPTFAGTIIFASINWQASLILLGYLSTEAETALYGAASRFLIPVSILMASYGSVIQPAVARHAEMVRDRLGPYLAKKAQIPLIAATFIAIAAPFLSRPIMTLLFGSNFEAAAPTLEILALSTIPFCLVMVSASGLIATNAPRVDLLANVLGVIVCFCSGAILIPRYGAVGAATAQLFSFISMAVVEIVYLSRKLGGFNISRSASVSAAGLVLIYAILWKQ